MINPAYSNQMILALFGRAGATPPSLAEKARPVAVPSAAPTAPAAREAGASGPGAAQRPLVIGGLRVSSREEYEARVVGLQKLAAAKDAVEAAFEAENGFRREASPVVVGQYNQAISGGLMPQSFGSHEEAATWALDRVTTAWKHVKAERFAGLSLADPQMVQGDAEAYGLTTAQAMLMLEDRGQAARMQGVFEAVVLAKSLEVKGGPLLGKQTGPTFLNNVEVRHQGRLVLTIEGHGEKVTPYNKDGEAQVIRSLDGFGWHQPTAVPKADLA